MPVLHHRVAVVHRPAFQVHGQIALSRVIVDKVILDAFALVPQGQQEIGTPMTFVYIHDVPENRTTADLDHRFGLDLGFLGKARSQAAAENDCFHVVNDTWLVGWIFVILVKAPESNLRQRGRPWSRQ